MVQKQVNMFSYRYRIREWIQNYLKHFIYTRLARIRNGCQTRSENSQHFERKHNTLIRFELQNYRMSCVSWRHWMFVTSLYGRHHVEGNAYKRYPAEDPCQSNAEPNTTGVAETWVPNGVWYERHPSIAQACCQPADTNVPCTPSIKQPLTYP